MQAVTANSILERPSVAAPTICTIIAKNYLAHARVLTASFLEHHPTGRSYVLAIDEHAGYFDATAERFTLVTLNDLALPKPRNTFLFQYSLVELATAVKPFFFRYLFDNVGVKTVVYLDPDILVTAALDPLVSRLRECVSGVLLTPHTDTDYPDDGLWPDTRLLLQYGVFNLGFLGLRDGVVARQLLDWLEMKLRTGCVNDPTHGYFLDQKFFDLSIALFDGLEIERRPGYNVGWWNFHSRVLSRAANGSWLCNGEPLVFFHFSWYMPDCPEVFSRDLTRYQPADRSDLQMIYSYYRDRLLQSGYEQCRQWPYSHDYFCINGKIKHKPRIPIQLRRIYLYSPSLQRRVPEPFVSLELFRVAVRMQAVTAFKQILYFYIARFCKATGFHPRKMLRTILKINPG
jgi:hypothetical protein